MCPMYINQTESIRLDYELRRWIGGDSDHENWTDLAKSDMKIKSLGELLLPKPLTLRKKFAEKIKLLSKKEEDPKPRKTVNSVASTNSNAVEVFSPILRDHAALFDALKRRDDTFYVVWFSGEHVLLPASRQNNTARPRMSLVFPASSVNGEFMIICLLHTHLLHIFIFY